MVSEKGGLHVSHRDDLFDVFETCSSLPAVRREVIKNSDNNLWWPVTVKDWRLRLVIAGWSPRVSYRMITSYRRVVFSAVRIGYENLCQMSDKELVDLIRPLGLYKARVEYLKSLEMLVKDIEERGIPLIDIPNDLLVEMIRERVERAGYNVAQCAALYAKGYHSGIFPVDSGMKDILGPCLGLRLPQGPASYEIVRKQMETLLDEQSSEIYGLTQRAGYSELAIPKDKAPIWWAHLVLIYFKRLFCNKKEPALCPLRANAKTRSFVGAMCDPQCPKPGEFRSRLPL